MRLLTVKQTAKLFHVTERCVQLWAKEGLLPSIRIKGTVRIIGHRIPELDMEMVSSHHLKQLDPDNPMVIRENELILSQ